MKTPVRKLSREPLKKLLRQPLRRPLEAAVNHVGRTVPVRLMLQNIPLITGHPCMVMWDSGSQASLVTTNLAKARGFKSRQSKLRLCGLGESFEDSGTVYVVPLVNRRGDLVVEESHAVGNITSPVDWLKPEDIEAAFPEVGGASLETVGGQVDLLIGMDRSELIPQKEKSRGRLSLYRSEFGRGWLLGGDLKELGQRKLVLRLQ